MTRKTQTPNVANLRAASSSSRAAQSKEALLAKKSKHAHGKGPALPKEELQLEDSLQLPAMRTRTVD